MGQLTVKKYNLQVFELRRRIINIRHITMDSVQIIEEFADYLEIGMYCELERLGRAEGVGPKLAGAMEKISKLFLNNLEQIDVFMVQVDFYRDMMRKIVNNEEIREEDIDGKHLIDAEKRQEMISFVRRVSELRSRISDCEMRLREERKIREGLEKDEERRLKFKKMEDELMGCCDYLREKVVLMKCLSDDADKEKMLQKRCLQGEQQIQRLRRQSEERVLRVEKLGRQLSKSEQVLQLLREEKLDLVRQNQQLLRDRSELGREKQRLQMKLASFQVKFKAITKLSQDVFEDIRQVEVEEKKSVEVKEEKMNGKGRVKGVMEDKDKFWNAIFRV